MLIFMSEYKTGSDEANNQCNEIEKIIKNYSKDGMLVESGGMYKGGGGET